MNIALRTIIVVLLLSLALAGMVAKKQYTLATGTPILLETRPIDPRSLFRGDYVRLNYDIGMLRTQELEGDDLFLRNEKIFVVLQKAEPYWQPVSLHHEKPTIAAGQVMLKGRVMFAQNAVWNPETGKLEKTLVVRARYGIENYFVPEGEGLELERPRQGEKIDLRVAVDRFGNAGIQAVLVNGKERYRETLF